MIDGGEVGIGLHSSINNAAAEAASSSSSSSRSSRSSSCGTSRKQES